jgi:hypothetical protein
MKAIYIRYYLNFRSLLRLFRFLLRYFSERVSPAVHDRAIKKEGFGIWHEEFIHDRYEKLWGSMAASHAETHKLHVKTRGDIVLKYFAERVAPGVHDVAAKKEGFGTWKEQ